MDVYLSENEEGAIEAKAREENLRIMAQCIDDAKSILKGKGMKAYETSIINLSIALFEKRASHEVFWKEEMAKEKFDKDSDK